MNDSPVDCQNARVTEPQREVKWPKDLLPYTETRSFANAQDDIRLFYYRGLKKCPTERGYLRDTCLSAQDSFKKYLDYFRIPYDA